MALALERPPDPQTLTWDAYLAEGVVNQRYDIVEGVRVFMPGPTLKHQQVSSNINDVLRSYQRATRSGIAVYAPLDIVVSRAPLHTRQPDVLYIASEQLTRAGESPENRPIEVSPTLVVEILSPSESRRGREDKLADYASIGVAEAWIVSPQAETIEVLVLREGKFVRHRIFAAGEQAESPTLPGLVADVSGVLQV